MKYRSIEISENVTFMLIKYLTKKYAFDELAFAEYKDLLNEIKHLNSTLVSFQNVGLVRHILFERAFLWQMTIPDEERLEDLYCLIMLIDDTLMRSFRAYHMRQINKEQLDHIQKEVNAIAQSAKERIGSGHVD